MDSKSNLIGPQELLSSEILSLANSIRQALNGRVRTSQSVDPARFRTLPVPRLESALGSLKVLRQALLTCQEESVDPWDDNAFLQLSLKQSGLAASKEFIDTIQSEDLVEGYNLENLQIYRNMRFMEVCGYSLEDVLTYEWFELYERSSKITNEVMQKVMHVVETGQTIPLNVGNHYMKERISASRQVCEVSFRYVGPLFSGAGKPAGVMISTRARILDEHPSKHELRFL